MIETYQSKWNQFINEEKHFSYSSEILKDLLMDNGGDEDVVEAYINSLRMDMKTNADDYKDFTKEDFIEDFENYVGDKMGS
jgi:hypothetical protein